MGWRTEDGAMNETRIVRELSVADSMVLAVLDVEHGEEGTEDIT